MSNADADADVQVHCCCFGAENAVRLCVMPAVESEPCQACAWSDDSGYFAWSHDWCKITIFGQNCIE